MGTASHAEPDPPGPGPWTGVAADLCARRGDPAATAGWPAADAAAVSDLLEGGTVQPVFQPIVDLTSGCPIGFEALTRGPCGHALEAPVDMFAAARGAGMLTALDATCVRAAIGAARTAGLATPWTLFVNIEPDSHCIDVLSDLTSASSLPVVVELTERALTADPAAVLGTVALIRRLGWGVALDDVGINPDSLALLPLIAPDIVKLDATLVQQAPDEHTAWCSPPWPPRSSAADP